MSPRRVSLISLLTALALLPPMVVLSSAMRARTGLERPYDVRYVPDGRIARLVSADQRLLVADLYWLSLVQYIGEFHGRERGFDKLLPLAQLVTSLDPRHGYAYQTAGIALSSEGYLDESDAILRKGIEEGPAWWTYPFYIAFNAFFYRGDYPTAARWARMAASSPGASTNITQLALSLETKAGRPEEAVEFLGSLKGMINDEKTAAAIGEQYKLAVVQRDFKALDAAVARFRERYGKGPDDLAALVRAGLIDRIPAEPFGGEYKLDRNDGRVHSSARDFRFGAPDRPHPIPARPR